MAILNTLKIEKVLNLVSRLKGGLSFAFSNQLVQIRVWAHDAINFRLIRQF